MIPAGGEGTPAPGREPPVSGAGHITCCICLTPIPLDQYRTARCWTDPDGVSCAAHALCLIHVGEKEIGLS